MDEKLKNEWIDMIIDEEEELTTEELHSLINPNSKKEYFSLVDNIVDRHHLKEGEYADGKEIFTQAYRRKFKTTAIKYFIEFEKDNSSYINTFPSPYPINIPDTTPWNPSYPVYPTQPVTTPWNPGVFFCTTSTN